MIMRTSLRHSLAAAPLLGALLGAALLFGGAQKAAAQNACGVPPSGLVRLWSGIGCTGQMQDLTASGPVQPFPSTAISNGTGQWIAVFDAPTPQGASHTLFIQNGCYYPDLSLFQWQGGGSWAGRVQSVEVLPPGATPEAIDAPGKVVGRCS